MTSKKIINATLASEVTTVLKNRALACSDITKCIHNGSFIKNPYLRKLCRERENFEFSFDAHTLEEYEDRDLREMLPFAREILVGAIAFAREAKEFKKVFSKCPIPELQPVKDAMQEFALSLLEFVLRFNNTSINNRKNKENGNN